MLLTSEETWPESTVGTWRGLDLSQSRLSLAHLVFPLPAANFQAETWNLPYTNMFLRTR